MAEFRYKEDWNPLEEVVVQSELSKEKLALVRMIYKIQTDTPFGPCWMKFSGPLRTYRLDISIPYGNQLTMPTAELMPLFKRGRDHLADDYTMQFVKERQPNCLESVELIISCYDQLLKA